MPSKWVSPLPLTLVPTSDGESFRSISEGSTGLPLEGHPGSFGFVRANHIHEGVDLYAPEGTPVFAVEDGIIIAIIDFTGEHAVPPSPWWHNTKAVLIEGESGVVVYGEITPDADYWIDDPVKAGDQIGTVTTVLKKDKGRPMAMLHLELHTAGTTDAYEWLLDGTLPESLRDPTAMLLSIIEPTDDQV